MFPEKLLYSSSKENWSCLILALQMESWKDFPGSEAADGMWRNNNESKNWENYHSTYFALQSLYLDILSCLNSELHRLQVKRCYFVQYCTCAEENVVLSSYYYLAWLFVESLKTCDTLIFLNVSLQFYCFIFVSCLGILVLEVFRNKTYVVWTFVDSVTVKEIVNTTLD